ncbi:hypothetical protein [Clostridium sp.]|uniref:hypothetical protein n=1 Tax=Clostridium sp. TaxID=1506 RepID=UPI0039954422
MSIQEYLQNCKQDSDTAKIYEELAITTEKENIEDLVRTNIRPTIQADDINSINLIDKIQEEVLELLQAESKENFIEEFWDVVQTLVNYADYLDIKSNELRIGIKIHNEKLINRGKIFKNF